MWPNATGNSWPPYQRRNRGTGDGIPGLSAVVTHPGDATDNDIGGGLVRNADAVGQALEEVPDDVVVRTSPGV